MPLSDDFVLSWPGSSGSKSKRSRTLKRYGHVKFVTWTTPTLRLVEPQGVVTGILMSTW